MALNEPRTIDYEFRAVMRDGWVWIFDNSARDFPCTATPHIWCEGAYPKEDYDSWDDSERPDGYYIQECTETGLKGSVPLCTVPHYRDRGGAWVEAHDMASEMPL